MRAKLWFLLVLTAVVVGGWMFYRASTALPDRVVIAGGPENGRYFQLATALGRELSARHGVTVDVRSTNGSLENYHLLRAGEADFALYQPDTARLLENDERPDDASFIANLYPEVLLVLTRTSLDVPDASAIRGLRMSLGATRSGDSAAALMLLDHLDLTEADLAAARHDLSYVDVERELLAGTLDGVVASVGLQAPVLTRLAETQVVRILEIPFASAMSARHASLWPTVVPAGYFRTSPTPMPPRDLETVSLRAKLLTTPDQSTRLVEVMTRIVLDEHFQRTNELAELFRDGTAFASAAPEFEMHPGASHVYTPHLKPLLDPDFVEGTEGLRSFVVSILVAGWLLMRWLRERRVLAQEHKLDRYVRALLEIERRQLGLDEDNSGNDSEALQRMLDEVTTLRQDALSEFSAHEMNEDPSISVFVHMCHALSDKINAKLTRQRLDRYLGRPSATRDGD